MSALKTMIQHLQTDSGFALMKDMPFAVGALQEIDARLALLEQLVAHVGAVKPSPTPEQKS